MQTITSGIDGRLAINREFFNFQNRLKDKNNKSVNVSKTLTLIRRTLK